MNKTKNKIKNADNHFKCHLINLYTNERVDKKVYGLNEGEKQILNYALALNNSSNRYYKI